MMLVGGLSIRALDKLDPYSRRTDGEGRTLTLDI